MLALVAFGYFYTVRPVYQKELVEEQAARLQLEAQRSSREIVQSRKKLQDLASARDELASTNAALSAEQARLQISVNQLGANAVALESDLDDAKSSIALQRDQIRAGQRTLLLQVASLYWWRDTINDKIRGSVFYKADEGDTLAKWADATPPMQPADRVIGVIDEEIRKESFFGLPEPHDISRSLLLELRAGIDGARDRLTCPTVDRKSWKKGWEIAKAAYESSVPQCTNWLAQQMAARERWSPAQLEAYLRSDNGRRDMRSLQVSCETGVRYHQKRQFVDAWEKLQSPCDRRLLYADEIGFGGRKALDPFPDPSPPTWNPAWFVEAFPK